MNWDEQCKRYACDIAAIYIQEPENILSCLAFPSVPGTLNQSYYSLVRQKELIPIENLPESEKVRLWIKAKQIGTGKKQCVEISKSIHLLEQLTK